MGRPKKLTDKSWLESEPNPLDYEISPYGGYHIPIEKLRPLLDKINGQTKNYKTTFYKGEYGQITVAGSIELTVTIDGAERTVTGAYNLNIADAPNGFWNGTLKSECTKNAAYELGRRFGRDLNKDLPKPEPKPAGVTLVLDKQKAKPDSKIIQQYMAAVERKDEAALTTLRNIYEIENY